MLTDSSAAAASPSTPTNAASTARSSPPPFRFKHHHRQFPNSENLRPALTLRSIKRSLNLDDANADTDTPLCEAVPRNEDVVLRTYEFMTFYHTRDNDLAQRVRTRLVTRVADAITHSGEERSIVSYMMDTLYRRGFCEPDRMKVYRFLAEVDRLQNISGAVHPRHAQARAGQLISDMLHP
jgi:hypothetical protein